MTNNSFKVGDVVYACVRGEGYKNLCDTERLLNSYLAGGAKWEPFTIIEVQLAQKSCILKMPNDTYNYWRHISGAICWSVQWSALKHSIKTLNCKHCYP